MRTARVLAIAATVYTALALTLGASVGLATAQATTPSAKEVAAAKKALKQYMVANAPKKESKPTPLDECPWGDSLVSDLAAQQDGYDATATGTPTVEASVYVDQTTDKGVRSIPCSVKYTDTAGESQFFTVVTYADPGLKAAAFGKAMARNTQGTSQTYAPPSSNLAGGKVEGYCIKYSTATPCSYVWSRDGLYVEIDSAGRSDANFTALRNVVPATVDSLQSLKS